MRDPRRHVDVSALRTTRTKGDRVLISTVVILVVEAVVLLGVVWVLQ